MWLSSLENGTAQLRSLNWIRCAKITVLLCKQKPYPGWFSRRRKSYPVVEYEHLFDMWLSSLEIDAAQLRSLSWIYCAEITVLLCKQKPYPVWFSRRRRSYPVVEYEHLFDMWLSSLGIGEVRLRPVTEIALKSPFLCVNRSRLIRYGFRAGAKTTQYSANIA